MMGPPMGGALFAICPCPCMSHVLQVVLQAISAQQMTILKGALNFVSKGLLILLPTCARRLATTTQEFCAQQF